MSKTTYAAIVYLTAMIVRCATISAVLYFVYNAIAWEFNLPPFGYWVCLGVTYLIHAFREPLPEFEKTE